MTDHDQPLLSPARRRVAVIGAVVAAVVLIVLGALFVNQSTAGAFDRPVDRWFVDHADYRTALWLADLGNGPVVVVIVALVVGGCLGARYPRGAVLAVLAPVASSVVTEWVVKPLVHRTKGGDLAYPSGHETGVATIAFVIVLLLLGPGRQRLPTWVSMIGAVVAGGLATLCALGLVASNYHYATDVIGGICVAAAAVLAMALLIDAIKLASGSPRGRGRPVGTASSAGTQLRPSRPSRPWRR
jgi:membrane-associated phospholipid phosphatase